MKDTNTFTNAVRPVNLVNESADVYTSPRLDEKTNSRIVIEQSHHEVHEGCHFNCTDVQNVNSTTLYYMITTPAIQPKAHMLFGLSCTGEMLTTVTEGADRTGTTPLVAINSDRNSSTASTLLIYRGYSSGTTDGATTIFTERTGATGLGAKTISTGDTGHSQEFILKLNTKYIIAVTTYANSYISLHLNWYEHTDAN